MKQSVNLVLALPVKEKLKLPASMMAKIWLAFVVILLIVYGWGHWQLSGVEAKAASYDKKQQSASQELIALSKKYSDDALKAQQDQALVLAKQIERKNELVAILDLKEAVNVRGFSSYLVGFAKLATPKIWLTSFEFSNGGDRILVSGNAVKADDVFQYMGQLDESKAFEGHQLKLYRMSSAKKEQSGPLFFELGTNNE